MKHHLKDTTSRTRVKRRFPRSHLFTRYFSLEETLLEEADMYERSRTSRFEQGQGLVEFAAAGMLLLIVIVGMLDLGRALFTFMTLRDAAQEGATFGAVNPTDLAAIENRVRGTTDHPVNLADKSEVDVKITIAGAACAGNGITVEVTYTHFKLTNSLLGAILGSQTIPIRATVTDTILRPPCK